MRLELRLCGFVAPLIVAVASHRGRLLSDLPRTKRGRGTPDARDLRVGAPVAAARSAPGRWGQGRPEAGGANPNGDGFLAGRGLRTGADPGVRARRQELGASHQ